MAFGTKKENKPVGVEEGLESSHINENNIDFLQPKKDTKKELASDPYRAEMVEKNAYQYTLKTLNALKIVSPIISALMENPGTDASSEELSKNFKILINETSNISELICNKLNIDPLKEKNFWIRNVLEKSVAEILHHQWISQGKADLKIINDFIDPIISFSSTTAEKTHYDEVPEESLVKLAGIRSMLPVLKEINNNSLYRNIDNDIEHIMTQLFNESKNAVEKLSDEYANTKDKSKLFYMIMQEAGTLYATSWKSEVIRVSKVMENHPPEKIASALEKYKKAGGFPLNRIDNDFKQYFDKMIVITDRLVSSQKGNIKNRLGKK